MKEKLKKYIEQYEKGGFTYEELEWEIFNLFNINIFPQSLNIVHVNKMLEKVSKETWISLKGNEDGFRQWYYERSKLNLNKS